MRGKIGIVTLFGDYNYGNRLQNYAVQQLLQDEGYDVFTLDYDRTGLRSAIRQKGKAAQNILTGNNGINKRKKVFQKFNRNELRVIKLKTDNDLIPQSLGRQFDFFVVGSDQVWNPTIRKKQRSNFFLTFTTRERRICVSPSIGVPDFEKQYTYSFKKGFQGFPYLCCREEDGAKAIQQLTGRECVQLLDPTLVLDCDTWRNFSEKTDLPQQYIVSFFLGEKSVELQNRILEYAQQRNAELIDVSDTRSKYYYLNPKQFVYLIDHANTVFTDSFHVTAFSINLHTDFYVFNRHNQLGDKDLINSRIISLTGLLGLKERYLGDNDFVPVNTKCNFALSDVVLEKERKKFRKYLRKSLSQKNEKPYLSLPEQDCTGCGCCAEVCVEKCLEMKEDIDGFLRPSVSASRCIACQRCVKACPVLTEPSREKESGVAFAAWNKERNRYTNSSSGAVFPLLAEYVLSCGGIVYGAAFSEECVKHIRISDSQELQRIYGAKYVQSECAGVYAQVKKDLNEGLSVLFSGTPCQVVALYAFLDKNYANLTTVDFVCHGVPSGLAWKKYKEQIKKDYLNGEAITEINFRKKEADWEHYSLQIKGTKAVYTQSRFRDPYLRAFIGNLDLRESCHSCKFKGIERLSDFTLGDFWGIQRIDSSMMNKDGTTLLIAHTARANDLWEKLRDRCEYKQIAFEQFVGKSNRAMVESVLPHRNRNEFFRELSEENSEIVPIIDNLCIENNRNLMTKAIERWHRIKSIGRAFHRKR